MAPRLLTAALTLMALAVTGQMSSAQTTAAVAPRAAGRAAQTAAWEVTYPDCANVVHVSRPPYNAKGDGVSDDTAALQRAINENTGRGRVLFFDPGVYLVSDTLKWPKKWNEHENWGFTMLQGQSSAKCVIRLKDGMFTDPAKPQSIMWCGGFGSADWFHNYVQGLTFDIGKNNPGAVGLQFYSNNYGAVRDCRILSGDGQGAVGLDLGHRDMNGPLLVRRVSVQGFQRGIATSHGVNSQTFEHITLSGQTQFGFDNEGQSISIRGFTSDNAVPAIRSYGSLCLLEARLTGRKGAANVPAIVNYNGGSVYLRDITTSGYARALGDVATPDFFAAYRLQGADKPGSQGPNITEYFSRKAMSAFPSRPASLRLPILETPEFAPDAPKTWAVVDAFGADPTGQRDSSAAIQKAIDSGAATVFLPGNYALSNTVLVRGKVRRIVGTGSWVDYKKQVNPDFRVVAGEAGAVTFEHIASLHGGIENVSDRTIVLRSIGTQLHSRGLGTVFFEDVAGDDLAIKNQRVYARQLNIENEGTHFLNDGGQAWLLGYKTERGGTLIENRHGGKTEIFGTFSYTTTAGKLAPMFVNDQSSLFVFFNEVCYNGDPFEVLVKETRGVETKIIKKGEGHTRPYVGVPAALKMEAAPVSHRLK